MLKKILNYFKKPILESETKIELSKIDRHMNLIIRESMGSANKDILNIIIDINHLKEDALHGLRTLHKAKLANEKIPDREIHIMEGNREAYIKKLSHFISDIDIPKNYLETYDYCLEFPQKAHALMQEIQKNVFVVNHFFANEIKQVNGPIQKIEENILSIKEKLERSNIGSLKEIQKDLKLFSENIVKIKDFQKQLASEEESINSYEDKIHKLRERVHTITSGSDYRALEQFRSEKDEAENGLKELSKEISGKFSDISTALKKFYYLNPSDKLIKEYSNDPFEGLKSDQNFAIIGFLAEIRAGISSDSIDLKGKKKEHAIAAIDSLDENYFKGLREKIAMLESQKNHAQTKITHNSASLNLSEQEYWMNANQEKIKYHESNMRKLNANIDILEAENNNILGHIEADLEKLMGRKVILVDDFNGNGENPEDSDI